MPVFTRTFTSVFFLITLVTSVCFSDGKPMVIAPGASSFAKLKKLLPQLEKDTGRKITLMSPNGMGTDSVFVAVDGGAADVGIASADWDDVLLLIKMKNYQPKNLARFNHRPLGHDVTNFITYKGGPKELSQKDLTNLFTGKVKNWKEIDGKDLPVKIVIAENMVAAQELLKTKFFDGQDFFRAGAKYFSDPVKLAKYVSETPGSIGFGGSSLPLGEVNHPKHPPFIRDITMIYLGETNPFLQKLEEELSH